MIMRGLDMAARGAHDGKIGGKCIPSRPFSLSKSGVRAYAGECAGEVETFADI
jgi:hypothetical protein